VLSAVAELLVSLLLNVIIKTKITMASFYTHKLHSESINTRGGASESADNLCVCNFSFLSICSSMFVLLHFRSDFQKISSQLLTPCCSKLRPNVQFHPDEASCRHGSDKFRMSSIRNI